MKIHLVTPRNPKSFWTFDHILPTIDCDCLYPNLSMPTVAGLTPREHEVSLCDENVEPIDFDVEADIVGVTGYFIHRERMLEIIDEFKKRGRFVVVGGPYASLCPEELLERCDVVFADEAEETWGGFLRDFQAGSWQRVYRPAEKPDLRTSPLPRFDLLKIDRYRSMTIQFARGCPFNCEFCDIIVVYGRRPRAKSVEQVLAEVEECRRLGAQQIFVVDDNFIGNKKLAKELLRALARWGEAHGYPIDFQTEVSLNLAQDDELLELMRAAHFHTVFIGIESPRRESLLETRKTQNTRGDVVENVRRIQAHGIQVQAGMIVGFDSDDTAIFEEQLRFLEEARIPVAMTGMLQAVPKTPLYARVAKEGRLLPDRAGDQFVLSNISPKRMTLVELYRGYSGLLEKLYSFRHFRTRAVGYLLHRGGFVRGGLRLHRGDLRLFARILRDMVLRGGARRAWFTLSLLATTLLRRPSAFREAVSFAVAHKGLHEYVADVSQQLERHIRELERKPAPPAVAH